MRNTNENLTDEHVREALASHASNVRAAIDAVASEALHHALAMHNSHMERSADGLFEASTVNEAENAQQIVDLIWAVLRSFSQPLHESHFSSVLVGFARWAHFRTLGTYRELHERERELLIWLCQTCPDPGALLQVLEPWESLHERQEESRRLRHELAGILEMSVDATLNGIFDRAGGIGEMFRDGRVSERWCLLRHSAWPQGRIEHVSNLTTEANADNCFDLLRLLANGDRTRRVGYGFSDDELNAMAADIGVTSALWRAFATHSVNVRMFTDVERVRESLERQRGAPLADPPWWQRVRALRDEMHPPETPTAAAENNFEDEEASDDDT